MSSRLLLTAAIAAVLLSGCATRKGNLAVSADPNFGEASRYNAAVQIINPTPVYGAEGAQPGDNGERAVGAVERYRQGEVTDVEAVGTTTGAGGPQ